MLRNIGKSKLPAVGLGCMGMSEFYGKTDDDVSLNTLMKAFEMGYRHFDTADMYGKGHNETLLGRFINHPEMKREDIFLATKGGIVRDPDDKYSVSVNSSADYIKKAVEDSLQRLKTDYIDLYYVHRLSPESSLEETMAVLASLKKEGKIINVGLCEVSEEQLRAANNLTRIAAVQSELSLWSRDSEESVLPACIELDVAFVAFSPLGRGFLSGNIDKSFMNSADSELDFRKRLPRFSEENIDKNINLVKELEKISQEVGVSTSELSLSWVLQRSPNVHIIPGSKTEKYLASNFSSQEVALDPSVVNQLDRIFSDDAVAGSRYPQKILEKSST